MAEPRPGGIRARRGEHAVGRRRSRRGPDGRVSLRRFELIEPRTLDEALGVLAERPDALPIAGGTAVLVLVKQGIYQPGCLVNLGKIAGGAKIEADEGGLRIGALASIHDVETSPLVRTHYPMLAEACRVVANIRIRNLATIGGNLAHADHQSDPPAALLALDARVELAGPRGQRRMALEDFILGSYETALEPGELVRAIVLPPEPSAHWRYVKFTTRSSTDRPCADIAVLVRRDGDRCEELRLVVGAVSPVAVRVRAAEALARGERLTAELAVAIARMAAEAVEPVDDARGPAEYKRRIVAVLTGRAISSMAA